MQAVRVNEQEFVYFYDGERKSTTISVQPDDVDFVIVHNDYIQANFEPTFLTSLQRPKNENRWCDIESIDREAQQIQKLQFVWDESVDQEEDEPQPYGLWYGYTVDDERVCVTCAKLRLAYTNALTGVLSCVG